MTYSFSSTTSFETCAYGFKLNYIEAEDRVNNVFSDYGLLVHKILEGFFGGELSKDELLDYYKTNWSEFVKSEWPPYPQGMENNYYESGIRFFENFDFNKDDYEIIFIEEAVYAHYAGIDLVVKPDLILRHKESGKVILVDYKTAKIKGTKSLKKKQIEDYLKQFYLYVQFLYWEKDVKVDEIQIWFIRDQKIETIPVDPYVIGEVLTWFEDLVKKIKTEEEWPYNNSKENQFFCNQLCGVRLSCPYR